MRVSSMSWLLQLLLMAALLSQVSGQTKINLEENEIRALSEYFGVGQYKYRHNTIRPGNVPPPDISSAGSIQFDYDALEDYFDPENNIDRGRRNVEFQFGISVEFTNGTINEHTVAVVVKNIDDEKPVFIGPPRVAVVLRSAAPGALVYKLQAYDDSLQNVTFTVRSGSSSSNFRVESSGEVLLVDPNDLDAYEELFVVATAAGESTEDKLTIYSSEQDPIFDKTSYTLSILEGVAGRELSPDITAYSVNPRSRGQTVETWPIEYSVSGQHSSMVNIGSSGRLELASAVDFENPEEKSLRLNVIATEKRTTGARSSSVPVLIEVKDDNDNGPQIIDFTPISRLDEDKSVGSDIGFVKAVDADSNENQRITYFIKEVRAPANMNVRNIDFPITIDPDTGRMSLNGSLDYETVSEYEFVVSAQDNGPVPLEAKHGKTYVIRIINKNDEQPFLRQKVRISETREPGSEVDVLKASDPDGSGIVNYIYNSAVVTPADVTVTNPKSYFSLDMTGGSPRVSLVKRLPDRVASFILTFTVQDDGKCCGDGSPTNQGTGTLEVEIIDENDNTPTFDQCNDASIAENSAVGTPVTTIVATDQDRGLNGQVRYELGPGPATNYLRIDSTTGLIDVRTSTIDRDTPDQPGEKLSVMVFAKDSGDVPNTGRCTLEVTITDVNDNDPEMLSRDEVTISLSTTVGASVFTVLARDADAGANGRVRFRLVSASPSGYVKLHEESGVLTLNNSVAQMSGRTISLTVELRDSGTPARSIQKTILVKIQGGAPPTISPNNFTVGVAENVSKTYVVASVNANNPQDGSLSYFLTHADPYFYMDHVRGQIKIITDPPDYDDENKRKNTLSFGVSNGVDAFGTIVVLMEDVNDLPPVFQGITSGRYTGSVQEEQSANVEVQGVKIEATDGDTILAYRTVTYSIVEQQGTDYSLFAIDPLSGRLTTRARLDREEKKQRQIVVEARDGAPSSDPQLRGEPNTRQVNVYIEVRDINDHKPSFNMSEYLVSVREDIPVGSVVYRMQAFDLDDTHVLNYKIKSGNELNFFEIIQWTGEVKTIKPLDYEDINTRSFTLVVEVDDGLLTHENSTLLKITVTNTNDNRPVFGQEVYTVSMKEEQNPSSQPILNVSATDADEACCFKYFSSNPLFSSPDPTFRMDPRTGELFVLKKLDREDNEVIVFGIEAQDVDDSQPYLIGYATVRVTLIDINDNAPRFVPDKPVGRIKEHSPDGTQVIMDSLAIVDLDLGANKEFTASLIRPQDAAHWRVSPSTGELFYVGGLNLDAESAVTTYYVPVKAVDKGTDIQLTGSATYTVHVDDINDQPVTFTEDSYERTVPEDTIGSVMEIPTNDKDSSTVLVFTVLDSTAKQFFQFRNNEQGQLVGVLEIYKELDYDTMAEKFIKFTIKVDDGRFNDTAEVTIYVTDVNDNAPKIEKKIEQIGLEENVLKTGVLVTYTAEDDDSGRNKLFRFQMDRSKDEGDFYRHFDIRQTEADASGKVTGMIHQMRAFDYESDYIRQNGGQYEVKVLAVDEGSPPMTGSATLRVMVANVNDNWPQFSQDYDYSVRENVDPVVVLQPPFTAYDPDGEVDGPFTFAIPSGSPACQDWCPNNFALSVLEPVSGVGSRRGEVSTQARFDREQKAFYYLPVLMSDEQGTPTLTGTNTLTVRILDENDNKHEPSVQSIHVYNYQGGELKMLEGVVSIVPQGQLPTTVIGRVSARDPDSDHSDKTYTEIQASDGFSVNQNNGDITMTGGTKDGRYQVICDVTDTKYGTARVTVNIVVQEIGVDAVTKSGSFRFIGITPEQLIFRKWKGPGLEDYEPSKYDLLRNKIAETLNTGVQNVDIFSVEAKPELNETVGTRTIRTPVTDVRYSAHGSPYYQPERMNGLMQDQKSEIEQLLGASIMMVPVDECLLEENSFGCESGCTTQLSADPGPRIINTEGTSLSAVVTDTKAACVCAQRNVDGPVESCNELSCMNGGTCHDLDTGVVCECRPGFDGPRCQQLSHSFDGSGSFAWYKPLSQCADAHMSLEFMTQEANGVILYNGPHADYPNGKCDPWGVDVCDYLSLYLVGGRVNISVDLGSGHSFHDTIQSPLVNDGRWHRLDLFMDKQDVRLMLDQCAGSNLVETASNSTEDRSRCEVSGRVRGVHEYMNANTPLNLGGRSHPAVNYPVLPTKSFRGCIKNLRHNGELYDLHTGTSLGHKGDKNGCPANDRSCHDANDVPRCGGNATCVGDMTGGFTCTCKPGFRAPPTCDVVSTGLMYQDQSFTHWSFKQAFFDQLQARMSSIRFMFKTTRSDGVLFQAASTDYLQFMYLELTRRYLQFRYNLGSGTQVVSLPHVDVDDNAWHSAVVQRVGRQVTLLLDGGELRYYAYSSGKVGDHQEIAVSRRTYGGSTYSQAGLGNDYVGCGADVRYDMEWLPMTSAENPSAVGAVLVSQNHTEVTDACRLDACAGHTCTPPLVCVPIGFFRKSECRCPMGWSQSGSGDDIVCIKPQPVVSRSVSGGMIGALVACIVALILLVVVFVACARRRYQEKDMFPEDDGSRENIVFYDEEAAGEEDQNAFDINPMRKPVGEQPLPLPVVEAPLTRGMPPPSSGDRPPLDDLLNQRQADADRDPDNPDQTNNYNYEGEGSSAGSLSSLASSSDSAPLDFDYLRDWPPKFSKLADLYANPEDH